MLMVLAGLSQISHELYEAARTVILFVAWLQMRVFKQEGII
jgi:hypothetical protein